MPPQPRPLEMGIRLCRVNDIDSGSQSSRKSTLLYYRNWANLYTPFPASDVTLFLVGSLHHLIQCQQSLAMPADSRSALGGSISYACNSIATEPAWLSASYNREDEGHQGKKASIRRIDAHMNFHILWQHAQTLQGLKFQHREGGADTNSHP